MKFIVRESLSLIETLKKLFPESSNATLKSWIKEGRVSLNGRPVQKGQILLSEGQEIQIHSKKKFVEAGLQILYEDSSLVIIDKPAGVLSVSTVFQKEETAHAYLKTRYKPRKVYVIHRLDQETSGVMVFAFTEKAFEELKELFKHHAIDRIYYAVVEGQMKEKKGTWQSYLYEDANYKMHVTKDSLEGVLAITHYCVKAMTKHYSLLELKLETGKKNQIRVHCQQAGHPIAGDKKYSAHTDPFKRLALHAHVLGFIHPIARKLIKITSPIPEVFQKLFSNKF